MDVSENGGTSKSSILIGFSIITIHFGVPLIFGNAQIVGDQKLGCPKDPLGPSQWKGLEL